MVSFRFNGPTVVGLVFGLILSSTGAAGQTLGTRAAGLAEAFVAVADDATSVYWNPAGMATGAYFSFVADFSDGNGPGDGRPPDRGAAETGARFIGFTVPPLGVAYYRLIRAVAVPGGPAETVPPDREVGGRNVQALTTSHLGVTLAHSLVDALVVAGTFQLVRGEVTSGVVEAGSDGAALDQVDGLPARATSRFGLDVGVMYHAERWRVGLVARNLTTPSFGGADPDADPVTLDREVRAGVAWGSGWPGLSRLVLSADADLTTRQTATGERRDLAAGAETWWLGQRLGVRGGLRASVSGDARPVAAVGFSAAIRPAAFVEAHLARGARDEQSWSIGARVTF